MGMYCRSGAKECDGCGECQEEKTVMYDLWNEPIYEGDYYYVIDGQTVSEESLDAFLRLNREVCR